MFQELTLTTHLPVEHQTPDTMKYLHQTPWNISNRNHGISVYQKPWNISIRNHGISVSDTFEYLHQTPWNICIRCYWISVSDTMEYLYQTPDTKGFLYQTPWYEDTKVHQPTAGWHTILAYPSYSLLCWMLPNILLVINSADVKGCSLIKEENKLGQLDLPCITQNTPMKLFINTI